MANEEWGPLAGLIGEWQGEGGLDNAFSHSQGKVLDTTYLEKVTMKPFGPVVKGSQHLYGLDNRSAMWRGDEETATLKMDEFPDLFPHVDHNTLRPA